MCSLPLMSSPKLQWNFRTTIAGSCLRSAWTEALHTGDIHKRSPQNYMEGRICEKPSHTTKCDSQKSRRLSWLQNHLPLMLKRYQGHTEKNWVVWLQRKAWRGDFLPDRSASNIHWSFIEPSSFPVWRCGQPQYLSSINLANIGLSTQVILWACK